MRYESSELFHYGIKGQHWGERNFQNTDGSLTPAGRIRYGIGEGLKNKKKEINEFSSPKAVKKYYKQLAKEQNADNKSLRKEARAKAEKEYGRKISNRAMALSIKYEKMGMSKDEAMKRAIKRARNEKIIKAAMGASAVAAIGYSYKKGDIDIGKDHINIALPNFSKSRRGRSYGSSIFSSMATSRTLDYITFRSLGNSELSSLLFAWL